MCVPGKCSGSPGKKKPAIFLENSRALEPDTHLSMDPITTNQQERAWQELSWKSECRMDLRSYFSNPDQSVGRVEGMCG